jgi:hypothetical protein
MKDNNIIKVKGYFSGEIDQEIKEESIEKTLECIKEVLQNLKEQDSFFYYVKEQKALSVKEFLESGIISTNTDMYVSPVNRKKNLDFVQVKK